MFGPVLVHGGTGNPTARDSGEARAPALHCLGMDRVSPVSELLPMDMN